MTNSWLSPLKTDYSENSCIKDIIKNFAVDVDEEYVIEGFEQLAHQVEEIEDKKIRVEVERLRSRIK